MKAKVVSIIGFLIVIIFSLGVWADEVLLKNGNVLQGEVIQEYSDSIIFSTLDGRGRVSIKKDEIESIERKPLPKRETPPLEESEELPENLSLPFSSQIQHETLPKLESGSRDFSKLLSFMGSLIIVFLLVVICIIAFIVFIAISKKRPFVIRIICFLGILSSIMGILSGLTILPFLSNLKGFSLYFAVLLVLCLPLFTLIIYFNLFYLRRWAQIGVMVFLSLLIINGAATLVFKKNIIYEYSQKNAKQATKDLWGETEIGGLFPQKQEPFNWLGNIMGEAVLVLIFLYLLREKTKQSFSQKEKLVVSKKGWGITALVLVILFFIGDKAYQHFWTGFSKNPNFFKRPVKTKIEESVYKRKQEIMDSSDYKKVDFAGLSFYLPQGLEKRKLNSTENAVFLDRGKNRAVMMSVMPISHYNMMYIVEYARWNPMLLVIKIVAIPSSCREIVVVKEIKLYQEKGIFKICKENKAEGSKTFSYFVRVKDRGVEFTILGKEEDDFTSENNILGILSTIE